MMEREWRRQCAELAADRRGHRVAPASGSSQHSSAAVPTFNLVVPRSACPACRAPIRAWHNIPILSYLLLRGRCAACGARIALRYPIVELLTGRAVRGGRVAVRRSLGNAGCAGLHLEPDRARRNRYRSPAPARTASHCPCCGSVSSSACAARAPPAAPFPVDAASSIIGAAGGLPEPVERVPRFQAAHRQGRAWDTATSNCSRRSAHGSDGRCCC